MNKSIYSVVLVEPEIPQNTGTIARLCAATYTPLHLIKPLGFSLEDRYLKRAGLDYWPYLQLTVHESWEDYLKTAQPNPEDFAFFSTKSTHSLWVMPQRKILIFGKETSGLDRSFHARYPESFYTIPMQHPQVRSLNLSNSVSIALYWQMGQFGYTHP
jgi:tRNA (cytidine/uridine-2'-O-)-methyltransferase